MNMVETAGYRGERKEGYCVFCGIRYGRIKRRFSTSVIVNTPESTADALCFPPVMPQLPPEKGSFYEREFYQSGLPEAAEDSLFLNIWVPDGDGPFPVVLFFHGGAFDHGWSYEDEFDGGEWAKRGVILVTAQYRLGLLGYAVFRGEKCNLGLRDQALSYAWVRRNIASFGGDVSRVSLMGQSAGALSILSLLTSPLLEAKPYSVILMSSGGPSGPLPVLDLRREDIERETENFLSQRGITHPDIMEMTVPAILALQNEMQTYIRERTQVSFPFSPLLDGDSLPYTADEAFGKGLFDGFPVLMGVTADDIGGEELLSSALSFLERRRERGWCYLFSHHLPPDNVSPFHSCDLRYAFGTLSSSWRNFTPEDEKISSELIDSMTEFVTNGTLSWEKCPEYLVIL